MSELTPEDEFFADACTQMAAEVFMLLSGLQGAADALDKPWKGRFEDERLIAIGGAIAAGVHALIGQRLSDSEVARLANVIAHGFLSTCADGNNPNATLCIRHAVACTLHPPPATDEAPSPAISTLH